VYGELSSSMVVLNASLSPATPAGTLYGHKHVSRCMMFCCSLGAAQHCVNMCRRAAGIYKGSGCDAA